MERTFRLAIADMLAIQPPVMQGVFFILASL